MFHVKHFNMKYLLYILLTVIIYSCTSQKIKNGDLLFVETNNINLSGAIGRVTKKDNKISFDHIALVEIVNNNKFVLESTIANGSSKTLLSNFLKNNSGQRIVQYRLKKEFKNSILPAISRANSMIGKPYNTAYILNENSYYCSDYIQRSFSNDSIFELQPMTFINPETGKIDNYWLEFYNKLNLDVPEGELGCNPNGLAQSHKLQKIKVIKQN